MPFNTSVLSIFHRDYNKCGGSQSGGGTGSSIDGVSKNSRGSKTPPSNPEGKSDSPTHSVEEGRSPRKGGSSKRIPAPAGVFGMFINEVDPDPIPPPTNGKKEASTSASHAVEDDGKKSKRNGKK